MAVAEATATSSFSRLYDHNMFSVDQSEGRFAYSARKCRYHAYGKVGGHARQIIKAPFSLSFNHGRDRLVVRTLRCGRNNPGSNPGLGILFFPLFSKNLSFFFLQHHLPQSQIANLRATITTATPSENVYVIVICTIVTPSENVYVIVTYTIVTPSKNVYVIVTYIRSLSTSYYEW